MPTLMYSHNINLKEVADQQYQNLYDHQRRNANFAGAVEHGDKVHAFRDHLGIAPLFYRYHNGTLKFSGQLSDLVTTNDTLNLSGIRAFTQLGTARLISLFNEIHIVPPATVIEIDPQKQTTRTLYTYHLKPYPIAFSLAWDELIEEFERLLFNSIESQVHHDRVGLYLSGGIDSALIAIYLKRLGVDIHAYTSGPWGTNSSDVKYAQLNADLIGISHHEIHYLETHEYDSAMSSLPALFNLPHGTPTGLGIVKLWEEKTIREQPQVFFGQNCDTIMASVRAQFLSYFLNLLPTIVRKRIHPALTHVTPVADYIHLARNYSEDLSQLIIPESPSSLNRLQKIIMAGMYIGQTPSSSEVFTQPSFVNEQEITNPYHNMDVVEFAMGLSILKRLTFKGDGRFMPQFDKLLIRRIANQYLPHKVVSRTKSFTVSFDRDDLSHKLYDRFPVQWFDIPLHKSNERFAGDILRRFLTQIQFPFDNSQLSYLSSE